MKKYDKPDDVFRNLFEAEHLVPEVETEWVGMPTFVNEDKTPFRQIIVSFENEADVAEFARRLEVELTPKTKSVYFPKQGKMAVADLFWFGARDE